MGRPRVFLLGPPGVGKSSVGTVACERRRLAFLDLPDNTPRCAGDFDLAIGDADVIAIPWALQGEAPILRHARRLGTTVALWAHPETMRARASRPISFTPRRGLSTHGGFGRHGTSCPEYRRLERSCDYTLDVEGLEVPEVATELGRLITKLRGTAPGARFEELRTEFERQFGEERGAKTEAVKILADAMARFLLSREQAGASPRSQNALRSDLSAAAMLVFMYESPKGEAILRCFEGQASFVYEFERKFTDSRALVARYERHLGSFARFLRSRRTAG